MLIELTSDKPIILLDMDNSHVDYDGQYEPGILELLPPEALANQRHGEYYIENRFEEPYHAMIHDMMRTKGFFFNMRPKEGAVQALHDMITEGIDVHFCTTPHLKSEHCVPEKAAWVRKYLGDEFEEKIITAHDKTMCIGHILIDDKEEITGSIKTPIWKHVVFDAWYNQKKNTPHRLIHWKDWREVVHPILKSLGF